MKFRRYVCNNMQEAMIKVRAELGKDAVILNTKKVSQKGFKAFFGKPLIEVLAAVEEGSKEVRGKDETRAILQAATSSLEMKNQNNNIKNEKMNELETKVQKMEMMIEKVYNQLKETKESTQKSINYGGEEKRPVKAGYNNISTSYLPNIIKTSEVNNEGIRGDDFTGVIAELNSRKNTVIKQSEIINNSKSFKQHNLSDLQEPDKNKYYEVIYNKLIQNDIETEIAKNIISSVNKIAGNEADTKEIEKIAEEHISQMLGGVETLKLRDDGKPTVVLFVGPTGVGKSTTLAKIAANYSLKLKKKVGLITADTFRIAAVEQLKTYAEILGMPIKVVYTAAEINVALEEYSDKDVILIDTAGRSAKNKPHFEELKELVKETKADEVYLVLSTTTSSNTCKSIIENYNFIPNYKIIFTKLDETSSSGVILNTKAYTEKSLSYVTTGQSVPDDIEVVDPEKLTKSILGGNAE